MSNSDKEVREKICKICRDYDMHEHFYGTETCTDCSFNDDIHDLVLEEIKDAVLKLAGIENTYERVVVTEEDFNAIQAKATAEVGKMSPKEEKALKSFKAGIPRIKEMLDRRK